jgi:hypothetical protein
MAVQRYRLRIFRDGSKAKVLREGEKVHETTDYLDPSSDSRLRDLLVALAEESHKVDPFGTFKLEKWRLDVYPEHPGHMKRVARVTIDSAGRTVVER